MPPARMPPVAALLLVLAGPFLPTPSPAAPETLREQVREAAPAPLEWRKTDAREFPITADRSWLILQERAVTGAVMDGNVRRPIQQTRLRITEVSGSEAADEPRDLALVQHLGNLDVALLAPGDPRATQPGPLVSDPESPWPNVCGVSVHELEHAVDLNANGRAELVVRVYSTVEDPVATRLLLVEPDEKGLPVWVRPEDVVGTVRYDEGILTEIRFDAKTEDPMLVGELASLFRCRFLARLDLPALPDCQRCCMIPVVLQRKPYQDRFHPVYDKKLQSDLLQQTREDLYSIARVDRERPLSPEEEVLMAKGAAFFYLTGNALDARMLVEEVAGPRTLTLDGQLLLGKLDRFFLTR